MLRQTSLGTLGLSVGSVLTLVGIVAYVYGNATLNLAGIFYGIPILLGGLALKAAEITPVLFSQPTTPQVLELRASQATATQNQIRQDITRYRYGQKAHLDTTLLSLGLSPTDEERPVLTGLREEEINGAYALILEFDSPFIPLDIWQQKQEKMTTFFGPGVEIKVSSRGENQIDLAIIATPKA